MKISSHAIPDVKLIALAPREDARGYFMRVWDKEFFAAQGLPADWQQENQSLTAAANTLRGLHYQRPPFAEAKLVRCLQGRVLDLFVDLRKGSPSFGQCGSVELDAANPSMVLVPRGFAHGYLTLAENSLVSYKVDARYAPDHEGGIRWNDPCLGGSWAFDAPQLSEKDAHWPFLDRLPQIDFAAS